MDQKLSKLLDMLNRNNYHYRVLPCHDGFAVMVKKPDDIDYIDFQRQLDATFCEVWAELYDQGVVINIFAVSSFPD